MFRYFLLPSILCFAILYSNGQSIKDAQAFFEKGESELNKSLYTDAIQSFSLAISIKADFTEVYYYRGIAKENLLDNEGALMDYTIALEWRPNFAEVLLRRGQLQYNMNRLEAAALDFEVLLRLPQGETHDIFYRKTSFEPGISRIITAQGATDIIFNYLGLIATERQMYSHAIHYFDSAINRYSSDPDYFVNRGIAKEKSGDNKGAIEDFEFAITLLPDHGIALQRLSAINRKIGNEVESEHFLNEAILRNPHLPFAYSERAYYRNESGNYKGAIEDYSTALQIDSLNTEVWINRGLVYEKTGALAKAYQDYSMAIRLDEKLETAWFGRANILLKQNKYAAAVDDYTIAISLFSAYALAFYNRALAYYRIGDIKKACLDLIKAKELGQPISNKMEQQFCD